jgi:hypothetical protein
MSLQKMRVRADPIYSPRHRKDQQQMKKRPLILEILAECMLAAILFGWWFWPPTSAWEYLVAPARHSPVSFAWRSWLPVSVPNAQPLACARSVDTTFGRHRGDAPNAGKSDPTTTTTSRARAVPSSP